MKTPILKATGLLAAGAMLAMVFAGTARAQSSPEEDAITSGILGGLLSRATGHSPMRSAIPASALVVAVTYIMAKHRATERQRQIAEQRARRSYAQMSPKRKASLKAKKVRYIAVDTEKSAKTSAKAKKTVMVWDTQTQKVASNNAYDVQKPPAVGATAKIDNYSAEYVGSGLQGARVSYLALGAKRPTKNSDNVRHSGQIARVEQPDDDARFHHNVYVILLDPRAAKHSSVLRANPKREPAKPCVYVGMSGLPPEHRFENHKHGYKAAWVVEKYGVRLMPELYEHLNPMPYEAALQMEMDLAEDLRREGYTVTGGH